MSFFDSTKNFGTAMLIAGLIAALLSIAAIVLEALSDDGVNLGFIVGSIGDVIYGLMIAGMGVKVRNGEISKKIELLGQFIMVVGAGFFVTSLFGGIGQALNSAIVDGVVTIIIGIVVAFIVTWIAKKIMDGNATTLDKIIWVLLLVIFVIMILASLFGILAVLGGIMGILAAIASLCYVIVYIFLLITLVSDEVKKEMGI